MRVLPVFLSAADGSADLSLSESLILSLIGMAVVIVALVALMYVTKIISALSKGRKKTAQPDPVQAVVSREEARIAAANAKVVPVGMAPAPGSFGEVELNTVDDRTAALLMAIVADDMKAPLNELWFISIKEIS